MKSILLASASLVAFAGAAAAEVSFAGEATLGYNDSDRGDHYGFYWEGDLDATLSQELNNGLTASVTFGLNINEDNSGDLVESADFLLELKSENSSLQYGNVEFAAVSHWTTGGAWIGSADAFSEKDGETVLRGNVSYGGVDASISYVVADADGEIAGDWTGNDLDQLSIGATATFGNFNVRLAYQEASDALGAVTGDDPDTPAIEVRDPGYNPAAANGDFNTHEIFGVSVGTSFGGANVRLAYASDETAGNDAISVAVSYPVGPVTLTGWVSDNSEHSDLSYGVKAVYAADAFSVTANYESRGDSNPVRWNLEGSYNVGNGITAYAGVLGRDAWAGEAYYVAGKMDLGNGAALLVSYADNEDTNGGYRDDDEIGALELQHGLTAEITFTF